MRPLKIEGTVRNFHPGMGHSLRLGAWKGLR